MAEPKTKGMVALIPTAADAGRLAVDEGLPVEELHLTLLFLGDAADWNDDARSALLDAMRTLGGTGTVDGDGFALSVFNPASDERDTCIVLGVGGQAVDDFHNAVVEAAPDDAMPEQHAPWVAHVSLIYTDDLAKLADLVDRTGPITFDRLRVVFADDGTDIPLTASGAAVDLRTNSGRSPVDKSHLKTAQPMARLREGKTDWYKIQNLAGTGAAEVWIYDEIGWFGVSAQDFVRDLMAIKADRIDVHLNTPGGSAFDGLAIYQALRNHPAHITTYVDALAASAGSFIAVAGDERVIAPHATVMIHDAGGMCIGDAAEMAKMQDELARLSDNLANIYASRAGGEASVWREAMRAETWYSAEEAVAAGLAHRVQVDDKAVRKSAEGALAAKNAWDFSVFNYAGRDNAPAPRLPDATNVAVESAADPATDSPAPAEGAPNSPATEPVITTEPNPMEDDVSDLSDIARGLGLPDDAGKDAILAAVAERTPVEPSPSEPTPAPEPTPVPVPAPQPTEPVRSEPIAAALPPEAAAEMKRMSAELAQIREEKRVSAKAALFDSVVNSGKIAPAERAAWEARYDKAPDVVADILNAKSAGEAVPVGPSGVAGSVSDSYSTSDDALYAAVFGAGV
ncbi:MAG TPA: head maturation protease, ClpP-related [Micromonosporaceae bacterium]|nr:head maturation protease, ClpP-related [Micromonosporaceae bacterium]